MKRGVHKLFAYLASAYLAFAPVQTTAKEPHTILSNSKLKLSRTVERKSLDSIVLEESKSVESFIEDTKDATCKKLVFVGYANISKVYDGDTYTVVTEKDSDKYCVRVLGIDSPDDGAPFYREATAKINFTLNERGKRVALFESPGHEKTGSCHRKLYVVVSVDENGENPLDLAKMLVSDGLALAYDYRNKKTVNSNLYHEVEREASDMHRGLWGISDDYSLYTLEKPTRRKIRRLKNYRSRLLKKKDAYDWVDKMCNGQLEQGI